jgi:hypothetical protein
MMTFNKVCFQADMAAASQPNTIPRPRRKTHNVDLCYMHWNKTLERQIQATISTDAHHTQQTYMQGMKVC